MQKSISMTLGGVLAVGLMLGALFAWFNLSDRALSAEHPRALIWESRMIAIALGAMAQLIILWLVVGRLYENRALNTAMKLISAAIGLVAVIAAVALGLVA